MVTRPLNCPNCGAPIDYSQRKCAYCGTFYDEFEFDDEPIEYEVKGGLGIKVLSTFRYMGSLSNAECLPKEGRVGDIWYCGARTYVWTGPDRRWAEI